MNKILAKIMLTVLMVSLCTGCNYKGLVIKSSYLMVEEAVASFYEENDTQLAAEAAPANLKLIEGMARGAPDNMDIQLAAAQLIGMYAFGFLEDSTENEEHQLQRNERARKLYMRAFEYATRVLQDTSDFHSMRQMDLQQFENSLNQYGQEHVPALFWTAFNWGLYINLSRNDVSAISDISKVNAIARRIIELEENYFYGGAYLLLMVYHGSLGPAVGGKPEKTKTFYEKAWAAGDEKYLMTKYLFAKYYCQQTLNEELFEKLLNEITDAPVDLLREQQLSNALAKEKAARLLEKKDDIF